jgi:hypothetical protein
VFDDFVSQLGMSIIREDEGNLDAAIWHMERAFESKPANKAIQEKLRRIFGRRDGVEPQKSGLQEGALARMYSKEISMTRQSLNCVGLYLEDPNDRIIVVVGTNEL